MTEKRACMGGKTKACRMSDFGHGQKCLSCGTSVRDDLVKHNFFGFAAGCSKVTASERLIADARRWREENGAVGKGGVVVLFKGEVQGWVNELRNPEHWQPGCVAVDERGRSWTTIGGNERDGAHKWQPNEPKLEVVA